LVSNLAIMQFTLLPGAAPGLSHMQTRGRRSTERGLTPAASHNSQLLSIRSSRKPAIGLSVGPAHVTCRRDVALAVAAPERATVTNPPAPDVDDSGVLDCVVVGAGISGLVTAQALRTEHANVVPRCGDGGFLVVRRSVSKAICLRICMYIDLMYLSFELPR
jgi:hypothetical protein